MNPARAELGISPDAKVLVSVGGLVERKGFHRVIERLPSLLREFPTLRYVIVGGASPEGDMSVALHALVRSLGLIPQLVVPPLTGTAALLTTLAMAALGLGVDVRAVARSGARVTLAVTLSLVVLGVMSYALIRGAGIG